MRRKRGRRRRTPKKCRSGLNLIFLVRKTHFYDYRATFSNLPIVSVFYLTTISTSLSTSKNQVSELYGEKNRSVHVMLYVLELFKNIFHLNMDHYKKLSTQNSSAKTLFPDILPKKSSKSNDLTDDLVEENVQTQTSIDVTCYSSTILTRNEEVKKDQETSTDPTLTHQQLEQVRRFVIYYKCD